jgi:hypothetical protein
MRLNAQRNYKRFGITRIDLWNVAGSGLGYIIIARNAERRKYKPSLASLERLTRALVKSVSEDTGRVYPQVNGWRWLAREFDPHREEV